jgi:hypothetical protein
MGNGTLDGVEGRRERRKMKKLGEWASYGMREGMLIWARELLVPSRAGD